MNPAPSTCTLSMIASHFAFVREAVARFVREESFTYGSWLGVPDLYESVHDHLEERYGPVIREQILDRFRPHIHEVGGELFLREGVYAAYAERFLADEQNDEVDTAKYLG